MIQHGAVAALELAPDRRQQAQGVRDCGDRLAQRRGEAQGVVAAGADEEVGGVARNPCRLVPDPRQHRAIQRQQRGPRVGRQPGAELSITSCPRAT
jgi:hypothetical protein